MSMIQNLKAGEVWLANLNPAKGTEPGKTRPVLILQHQALLDQQHPSTIIIPLTTNLIDGIEPLRLRIKAQDRLEKDSDLLIDQIRAIDNRKLITGPLMKCNMQFLQQVYQALLVIIGFKNPIHH